MKAWHQLILPHEFKADMLGRQVRTFGDYLALEDQLFKEMDALIYGPTPTGPEYILNRYSAGSAADPRQQHPNWNRSFERAHANPVGGVLLLHGMSDSPYSMRALASTLHQNGYWVVGLRLPGHGTIPSSLRRLKWQDMNAAVHLGMRHLASSLKTKPLHIIGYSTGASLGLNFTLDSLEDKDLTTPKSLVLISPAIKIHALGALAGAKDFLSILPGLGHWAYMPMMDEFDPYKYNSFATNAASQVHSITTTLSGRIHALTQDPQALKNLPPILVLKSAVDSTVATDAVVNDLLAKLPAGKNELVLFDINRNAAIKSTLLVDDPGPLTERLMADSQLPFAVTFVTNENPDTINMVAHHKTQHSLGIVTTENLNTTWPRGLISLSHVALTFPPDDPLYGQQQPQNSDLIFLGDLAIKGERGLLKLPADWLLRLRYNPFYSYFQTRTLRWITSANSPAHE